MRVLIADASAEARSAIGLLLTESAGAQVVGRAACAGSLTALAPTARPDILVVDWELPLGRGPVDPPTVQTAVDSVRSSAPGVWVVVVSSRPEERTRALARGADAFVARGEPPSALLHAVQLVRD